MDVTDHTFYCHRVHRTHCLCLGLCLCLGPILWCLKYLRSPFLCKHWQLRLNYGRHLVFACVFGVEVCFFVLTVAEHSPA